MRINREQLLSSLEAVGSGLAKKEIVEQSACYVFRGGRVTTFDDEVSCSGPCKLDVEGAVEAEPLTALLRKLPDEDLDVLAGDGELLVKGRKRKSGVRMSAEILLPIEGVEDPEGWSGLPGDFAEAVGVVCPSASRDETQFRLTCVHLGPEFIEACDNFQITRWPMRLELEGPVMVKHGSLWAVRGLDMTEMCTTGSWLHFRNPAGVVLSCRRYEEDYPDLGHLLEVDGEKATLPGGIEEVVERAEIFSGENVDDRQVEVDLKPGMLRLRGRGPNGWYEEVKKIGYDGPKMSFRIRPDLLVEISRRAKECVVSKERILIDGGKFTYVSCTGVEDDGEA